MTIIRRARPFSEFLTLSQAVDRLFDDRFVSPRPWFGVSAPEPAIDAQVTADEFVITASLPGWKPEDVAVTLTGSTLSLSGELKAETEREEGSWMLHEIRRGSFSRTVELPDGLVSDKASATFENGVLTVRLPKAEQVKPRQIRINATTEGQTAREVVAAGSGADR